MKAARPTSPRLRADPFAAGKIKLDWTDNYSDEQGFKIERTTDTRDESWDEIASVGADITGYIDETDKRHDTRYYYRVLTLGGNGKVKYSNIEAVEIAPRGMAAIPAGCFEMGDAFGEGARDEVPVRTVCLPAFYMDVHEVTNAEYARCAKSGNCPESDSTFGHMRDGYDQTNYPDHPVIVDWNGAKKYCAWAGKRLPTEAEWEYAARGGLSGKRYPNGDTISCSDANYGRYNPSDACMGFPEGTTSCYDPKYKQYEQPSPCRDFDGFENGPREVGSYEPNGYGLRDMAGNVWEWVSDWYSADYYRGRPEPDVDPPGPGKNEQDYRVPNLRWGVSRGGSWMSLTPYIRVSFRQDDIVSYLTGHDTGFRCAADQGRASED